MSKVSCIIPFYNECNRVIHVLESITKVQGIDQIVCVDDGSSDETYKKILKKYPNVDLIRLDRNQGKTEAVRKGLEKSKYKTIFLIDADLFGIKIGELEQSITLFFKNEFDLLILQRKNDHLIAKILRWNTVLAGERIIKQKVLDKVLELPINRYQLEVGMNKYCLENKLNVAYFPVSHLYFYMFKKMGFIKGLLGEIKLTINFISYIKLSGFIYQVLFFCRKVI